MSTLLVEQALTELNAIVAADGAVIRLVDATETAVDLALDLTESTCPECVIGKDLLLEIIGARLAEVSPDVSTLRLHDPREDAQ
jgi:Fe-S cluster biogenesis protein NfuA